MLVISLSDEQYIQVHKLLAKTANTVHKTNPSHSDQLYKLSHLLDSNAEHINDDAIGVTVKDADPSTVTGEVGNPVAASGSAEQWGEPQTPENTEAPESEPEEAS